MTTSNHYNSMEKILYDLVIVGRGMIGSAAAHHAAKGNRFRIALVGPSEGSNNNGSNNNNKVFGAHYDEGRITRKTNRDPVWAELAASTDRFMHGNRTTLFTPFPLACKIQRNARL